MAQNTEGNLDKHRWKDRILLHWSLSGKAFSLQQQKEAAKFREELRERDLVLYYVGPDAGFGPKGAISTHVADRLISAYRLPAKSSGWLLIGKDGTEKARGSGLPDWPAIFARIDQMPMRQREMHQRDPER